MTAQPDRRRTVGIHNGYLWKDDGGQHPEPAGLFIENGRIARVLTPADFAAAQSVADESFDAAGCLLTSPLFDGHVHSTATLLRGTESHFPLELWSYYTINYGRAFVDRYTRSAILLTAAEMIRNGIGGYIDHFPPSHYAPVAIAAHRETGLRVGFAPFFADLLDEDILAIPIGARLAKRFLPRMRREPGALYELFLELHKDLSNDPRIRLLAGPNAPQRCSDDLWKLWLRLRRELDLGSHTHLLETLPQALHARERWPIGLIAGMEDAGLLDARLSVAHGVWLSQHDLDRLARHEVTVVHNPVSNLALGSGAFDVRRALDAGIHLALGSDSSNTGGRHDLFEIMRHILFSGRHAGSDYKRWITPSEAFRAATSAIRAFAPDYNPSLSTGSEADVLLLDFDRGALAGAAMTVDSLVRHADGRAVRALMIDGVWLYRNGRIEVFDEDDVIAEARTCAEALRRAGQEAAGDLRAIQSAFAPWYGGAFAASNCPRCGRFSMTPDW